MTRARALEATTRRAAIAALAASCVAAILLTASAALGGDAVTVQLKWQHQSQFAGLYVADAKGFYRSEGLDVRHREWKLGDRSPIEARLALRTYDEPARRAVIQNDSTT